MIDKKCFTTDWIELKAKELNYSDKNLIEKVIRALSLLDMLAQSGCPFCFKGGSCLMLLLRNEVHRLSIGIDILCPPGVNIEKYLTEYADNGFIHYQLVERLQAAKNVPKSHSKLFYQVAFKADINRMSYILLDVLYDECNYQQMKQIPIESDFIETVGEKVLVNVPSIEDMLGDKLTAFAPETTGIPYYKHGNLTTLEIIKQLFDVGRLFDKAKDITPTIATFFKIASTELGYRSMNIKDYLPVYEDIRSTALNIATRGLLDKQKFDLLQKGINGIQPFVYKQNYHIDDAIADAAKAAYLATLIERGIGSIEHYDGNPESVMSMKISNVFGKLNKLKLRNPEAFFYWAKIDGLS